MRPWKLKSILAKDKPIFGIGWTEDPVTIETAGELGLDFAIPDMEHTEYGYDFPTIFHLMRAGDATGLPCIVRVPTNDHIQIMKVLDAGAEGILVPHVNTKEDAIKAVKATRYPPEGVRGFTATRRPFVYGARGMNPEFLKESNKNVLTCLLIEEKRAVDNIEEIVSVKGVDAVWPGTGDMSVSMGLWGAQTKAVWDNYDKVLAAAKSKGVAAMCAVVQMRGGDKDPVGAIKEFIKVGGRIIMYHPPDPRAAKPIFDKVKESL